MIEPVTTTNEVEFLAYCRQWAAAHDESFVPTAGVALSAQQPSFLLRDEGAVVGAASLMSGGSWRTSGRARFAVLHAGGSRPGSARDYTALVNACREAAGTDFHELSLFLPEALATPRDHLAALGFAAERSVFLMVRPTAGVPEPAAEGYRLRALVPGDAERSSFLSVRNRNFRELAGAHDHALEDIDEALTGEAAWPGGVNLLTDASGQPCGTFILETDDEAEALFLGTITVDADRRGRGLGRFLVRSALHLAGRAGFARVYLAVNALNAHATRLYTSEGFTMVKAMVCLVGPVR
jgi:ribosomal protein S18 acetylase RimI-like enzyme